MWCAQANTLSQFYETAILEDMLLFIFSMWDGPQKDVTLCLGSQVPRKSIDFKKSLIETYSNAQIQ